MSDFLLELRCEEIPARMQRQARADLEKLFRAQLDAAGIAAGELTIWSTPRRLALIARGLPLATEAVSEEAKGPPEGAPDQAVEGFCRKNGVTRDDLEVRDVKGRPTYFAVKNIPGRAVKDVLAEAIPAIIRAFPWPKSQRWGAASISTESLRWVRPLSGIIALFDGEVVDCEIDGIASGRVTKGHRFHSRVADHETTGSGMADEGNSHHPRDITISGVDDYADHLRKAHVIVDHVEREAIVRDGAAKAAADAGLELVADEGLVVENAGLTEWPVPLLGHFDEDFLAVPPEVIQLTARVNQKYFVCEKDGKLANAFICTANIQPADGGAAIVDGNRKVLAARLSDARFFWDVDRKVKLVDQCAKLERITFHEKLGTVADKVDRVAKLAEWLASEGIVPDCDPALARQAAELCKADLVTEMVGEFPELQGLMGGYYARAEGLPDAVAEAIRDHYKPVGQGDDVPIAPVTVAVSLADKLDTLYVFFSRSMKPTGSKDPYALRRSTIGVLELLGINRLRLPLTKLVHACTFFRATQLFEAAYELDPKFGELFGLLLESENPMQFKDDFLAKIDSINEQEGLKVKWDVDEKAARWFYEGAVLIHRKTRYFTELLDFFADRLKVQQREAGVRHDLIDAVFALGGEDDLVRLLARVHALQSFITTDDGTNLLAGYKRAANILKKEDWSSIVTPAKAGGQNGTDDTGGLDSRLRGNDEDGVAHTGDEDPLENVDAPDMAAVYAAGTLSYTPEPAEQALIDALNLAEPKAADAIEAEDFEAAMAALATLRAPIDAFFEDVTVNDENPDKRAARLDLLDRFRVAVHNVADFSKIEG